MDFLEETSMIKSFKYNDIFLRPYMVSSCKYDYMIGSNGVQTPFKYDLNYRNYILITEGSINLKLAPPKSKNICMKMLIMRILNFPLQLIHGMFNQCIVQILIKLNVLILN